METESDDTCNAAYLYYISGGGLVKCYEYFDPKVPIGDPVKLARDLVENAIIDGTNPPCYCHGAKYMFRRRPGYIFVASEESQFGDQAYVKFKLNAVSYNNVNQVPADVIKYQYSTSISSDGRNVSIAIYTNSIKRTYGGAKLDMREWEEFSCDTTAITGWRSGLLADGGSGGTNMGPAPYPPGIDYLAT